MTAAGDSGGGRAFAPGRRLLARLEAVQAPRRRTAATVRERRRPKLLAASTRLARRGRTPSPPPLIPYFEPAPLPESPAPSMVPADPASVREMAVPPTPDPAPGEMAVARTADPTPGELAARTADPAAYAPASLPPALDRASPAALEWMLGGGAPPPLIAPSSVSLPSELVRSRERAARAELMRSALPVRRGVVHEGGEPLAPPAETATARSAPSPESTSSSNPGGFEDGAERSSLSDPPPDPNASQREPVGAAPSGQAATPPAREVDPPPYAVAPSGVANAPLTRVARTPSPPLPEPPHEPPRNATDTPSRDATPPKDRAESIRGDTAVAGVARARSVPDSRTAASTHETGHGATPPALGVDAPPHAVAPSGVANAPLHGSRGPQVPRRPNRLTSHRATPRTLHRAMQHHPKIGPTAFAMTPPSPPWHGRPRPLLLTLPSSTKPQHSADRPTAVGSPRPRHRLGKSIRRPTPLRRAQSRGPQLPRCPNRLTSHRATPRTLHRAMQHHPKIRPRVFAVTPVWPAWHGRGPSLTPGLLHRPTRPGTGPRHRPGESTRRPMPLRQAESRTRLLHESRGPQGPGCPNRLTSHRATPRTLHRAMQHHPKIGPRAFAVTPPQRAWHGHGPSLTPAVSETGRRRRTPEGVWRCRRRRGTRALGHCSPAPEGDEAAALGGPTHQTGQPEAVPETTDLAPATRASTPTPNPDPPAPPPAAHVAREVVPATPTASPDPPAKPPATRLAHHPNPTTRSANPTDGNRRRPTTPSYPQRRAAFPLAGTAARHECSQRFGRFRCDRSRCGNRIDRCRARSVPKPSTGQRRHRGGADGSDSCRLCTRARSRIRSGRRGQGRRAADVRSAGDNTGEHPDRALGTGRRRPT